MFTGAGEAYEQFMAQFAQKQDALTLGADGGLTVKAKDFKGVEPASWAELAQAAYRLGVWATTTGRWSQEEAQEHLDYVNTRLTKLVEKNKLKGVLLFDMGLRIRRFIAVQQGLKPPAWMGYEEHTQEALYSLREHARPLADRTQAAGGTGVKAGRVTSGGLAMLNCFAGSGDNRKAICRKHQDGTCAAAGAACPKGLAHVCHRCRQASCSCTLKKGAVGVGASAAELAARP
jgi:hypothetical protein